MADGTSDSGSSSSSRGSRATRAGCARSGLLVLGSILVVVYMFTQIGSGGGGDHHPTSTTEPQVTTTLAVETEAVAPTCPAEDGTSKPTRHFTTAPPMCIDPAAGYVATVQTNRGDFTITLDAAHAPKAVNSFVFLARWHYYDGAGFVQAVPNFLVQLGDPVNSDERGDAGYLLPEEPPAQRPYYPRGSVMLANNPPKPNTTGSELEIIVGTGKQVDDLPPVYTRFGTVTDGLNVVDAIAATGRKNDEVGAPTSVTYIKSVTIEQVPAG